MFDATVAAAKISEPIAMLPRGAAPAFVGLNGAQGAGKSTLVQLIAADLENRGLRCVILSLDDFYLTRAEREELALAVHPMCATRGVPGTHDVSLLKATLASLADGGQTALPRFDKLADDRLSRNDWPNVTGQVDVVILEGWCVGLLSDDVPAWSGPINQIEAECDPAGVWFAWSRAALQRDYDRLWRRLDLLASIEVPDWESVVDSRLRQEREAAAATGRSGMERADVAQFVQYYERYTRALWSAMPQRADILLRRNSAFAYSLARKPNI